jgi:ribonuclease T
MSSTLLAKRFRGFLPVVVDVETGGLNSATDALLELAAVSLEFNDKQQLVPGRTFHYHILPFNGANLDESSLKFTGITDPYHPFRFAISEQEALDDLFHQLHNTCKQTGCERAVLIGHNPSFDLGFIQAAAARSKLKKNPFHRFTTFDTATLSALAFGQTVLAKALAEAGVGYDSKLAHTAIYDAEQTAKLFCLIVNRWAEMDN